MDTFENASPAEKSCNMTKAVCWECGRELECFEYIVCCTGTLFHVCPDCEEGVTRKDQSLAEADALETKGEVAPTSE